MDEDNLPDAPDIEVEAADAARVAVIEAGMAADGVATHTKVQEDYFGFEVFHQTYLPDGISFVQHKEMNEGQRKQYLNKVNRDVRVQKATQDMLIRMAPGDERYALLEVAIVGWNLVRDGQPLPFDQRTLKAFLDKAPPKVIDVIEKAVRLANPWLLAEVTAQELRTEIADLTELLAKKEEEEAGKLAS